MGICDCGKPTVWNDMCDECLHAYEDEIYEAYGKDWKTPMKEKYTGPIYIVYINADLTEGRGPMVQAAGSGYFTDEAEAWAFADTFSGVMGRRPQTGTWRNSHMGDVTVMQFNHHNDEDFKKLREVEQEIRELNAKKLAIQERLRKAGPKRL